MIRQMIKIDEDRCNGCGLCIHACHEGALKLVSGKAKLMRDDYCDGLGNCLPVCPTGAIGFERREAAPFDEVAALAAAETAKRQGGVADAQFPLFGGCPGSKARNLVHKNNQASAGVASFPASSTSIAGAAPSHTGSATPAAQNKSELQQWPVQIKLMPVNAPYFQGAKLLVAADCTAFAYRHFHEDFIKGHVAMVGCPKLDEGDYTEKLTEILRANDIKSVTVARMEVPCCGGIENAVKQALINSGKVIPWRIATISIDGQLSDR